MSRKNREYKPATVTLKTLIWDNAKKVEKGAVFEDEKCFEGKYGPDTADVVFHDVKKIKAKEKADKEKKEAKLRAKLKAELKAEIEAEMKGDNKSMSEILK